MFFVFSSSLFEIRFNLISFSFLLIVILLLDSFDDISLVISSLLSVVFRIKFVCLIIHSNSINSLIG